MFYKAWMFTAGDSKPATNGLLFRTREQADQYARELSYRWLAVTGWEIREATAEESERDSSSLEMTDERYPITTEGSPNA